MIDLATTTMWTVAKEFSNQEEFEQTYMYSPVWGAETELSEEDLDYRRKRLVQVWLAAHRTFTILVQLSGLSQKGFSQLYAIPVRSVENWCRDVSTPPPYVVLLLSEAMGLI